METFGKLALGATAVVAGSLVGVAAKAVSFGDDLQGALNGMQASVGMTTDQMGDMKGVMVDIYNNNFGESFEDIGVAMAEVAKQTGLMDEELQWATESALLMRDSFGFEVADSVRAASMMMDQFGVSGDTAYDLIAQGAQYGLDKNGDLLDTINEYSVHFESMGFSAEEMFNMLVNGSESGTFSVDKLGDAVKEFGIRTKDGSDTSRAAFDSLGLNADEMFANFAAGGETGKAAFELVNERISAIEDPLAQSAAGVALYGTQWEDLGAQGVLALSDLDGSINQTEENLALMDLNQIKYDTFGEAMSGIGRQMETGILLPISEKILPILGDLATKFQDNMPQIQAFVETAMTFIGDKFQLVKGKIDEIIPVVQTMYDKFQEYMPLIQEAVSTSIEVAKDVFDKFKEAIGFVKDNADILIPVLGGLVGAFAAFQIITGINTAISAMKGLYDALKASTILQTFAQGGLNAVMAANPFAVVAIVIGLLIAAGIALYQNWDTVKATASNLWSGISDAFGKIGSKISEIMDGAKTKVKTVIDAIKGFFDFEFSLPRIPTPSFSVTPAGWKIGDLLKGSIPDLGISWNAAGGIFTKPTVFDTANGLQGFGEAGPEAILPLSKLPELLGLDKQQSQSIDYSKMADAIVSAISRSDLKVEMDRRQFGRLVGELA